MAMKIEQDKYGKLLWLRYHIRYSLFQSFGYDTHSILFADKKWKKHGKFFNWGSRSFAKIQFSKRI